MKEVLFDLYGTLVDIRTDEIRKSFWIKLAKEYKGLKNYNPKELKNEYLRLCKELSKDKEEIEILDVFKRLYPNGNAEQIAWKFRRLSTKRLKLYPGAKAFISKLKNESFKVCLLSNAQAAFTIPELKKLGIINMFDDIAISSNYSVKKPNKEFYKAAIKDFKLENPIMIGNDYACDIKPALDLGLNAIYIETNITPNKVTFDKIIGADYKKVYSLIKKYTSD